MNTKFNPTDKIAVDVPLFIRLLEFAREDAKTDLDLHKVTENILAMSEGGKTLTMDDYEGIVKDSDSEDRPSVNDQINNAKLSPAQEPMNEVKRMQQLAGILNERYGEEDASESPYKQKELTGNEKVLALNRDVHYTKSNFFSSLEDAEETAQTASIMNPKLFYIVTNSSNKQVPYHIIMRNLPYSTRFKSISIYKKGQKVKDPTNRI